ncbi:MAG: T9SS type A sorting domain-containing protein [Bacteroidota bacterium]|nr:T9SS type A sorting domain-containing protein [Bacteroidota bacterium]
MKTLQKCYMIILLLHFSCTIIYGQPFSLDNTFESSYVFRDYYDNNEAGGIISVIELDDGSLRIGGGFQDPFDIYNIGLNIKLHSNGMFDPSYGIFGGGVGLSIYYRHPYIYYLNWGTLGRCDYQTGIIDTVFYNNKYISNYGGHFNDLYILDNGDLLIGGGNVYHAGLPDVRYTWISRIKENGFFDTSFHHDANNHVKFFLKYDENRIMIAGNFTMYDSIPINQIARIYNDGSLDTSFHSILSNWPKPLYIQDDGKVIVGGVVNIQNYDSLLALVRLNPDGSLDSSFNNFNNVQSKFGLVQVVTQAEEYYHSYTLVQTTNNKYIVGGNFANYQGYERHHIVLTDLDGFIDTTIFTGSGIDTCLGMLSSWGYTQVNTIVPAQNDKYYVAGKFSGFNGQMVEPIIRLNPHDHVGVEEQEEEEGLLIYPNPAKETLLLNAGSFITEVEVFSLSGRLVKVVPINSTRKSIDVSEFPSGNYILRAISRDEVWVKKFVIIR